MDSPIAFSTLRNEFPDKIKYLQLTKEISFYIIHSQVYMIMLENLIGLFDRSFRLYKIRSFAVDFTALVSFKRFHAIEAREVNTIQPWFDMPGLTWVHCR